MTVLNRHSVRDRGWCPSSRSHKVCATLLLEQLTRQKVHTVRDDNSDCVVAQSTAV